ncbi:brain and acute leukemia cytoplasmic protein isoform X1 [Lemur catta]|uniref:brain and acute leukemia cytoplasmic protein isoform X1 n=1 Tax=Lemur catta TaxID=9447 RepID=UPI001E26DEC2|nr:brain and acute leukemia cytoplasmic protein isoform X1 [Lemur catta]
MGCGGSRADAIEPRYYESWTRETESTWLTYTDSDALPSAAGPDSGPEAGGLHAVLEAGKFKIKAPADSASDEGLLCAPKMVPLAVSSRGVLEDGLSSNGVPRSTAPGGISNPEKKTNCGTQCPNPQNLSSGPLTQKQNSLRTTEAKRDTKRMSAKEVTINVTDSIRQMDKNRRITKNCVN